MNRENSTSAASTATTSTTAPSKPKHDELSESDYLARQAAEAKVAMRQASSEMKAWLVQSVSPIQWTRQHPWIGLSAGAVAGFVAATMAVPSKEQQALRKLRRIEAALNPSREARQENGKSDRDHDSKDKKKGSLLGTLLHELAGAAGPLLMSVLNSQNAQAGAGQGQPAGPSADAGASTTSA